MGRRKEEGLRQRLKKYRHGGWRRVLCTHPIVFQLCKILNDTNNSELFLLSRNNIWMQESYMPLLSNLNLPVLPWQANVASFTSYCCNKCVILSSVTGPMFALSTVRSTRWSERVGVKWSQRNKMWLLHCHFISVSDDVDPILAHMIWNDNDGSRKPESSMKHRAI